MRRDNVMLRHLIREMLLEDDKDSKDDNVKTSAYDELPDASFDVKLDDMFVDAEAGKTSNEEDTDSQFDVATFASDVARIIENFDNLVDVKGLVLRRAINYVGKKYDADVSENLKDILETQFSLTYEETEEPQPPRADRAGPAMAG